MGRDPRGGRPAPQRPDGRRPPGRGRPPEGRRPAGPGPEGEGEETRVKVVRGILAVILGGAIAGFFLLFVLVVLAFI
ncbi:hypothetical protein [Actinomadura parmotrematis]|uniref:Uncharacterized protein n=1 Tax=Actinomadura parmotrematis TaxID=2864039 RepID=A0ABS7FQ60_9ACTN|nr:hypothetical protein [Actinomadura parmotrematis]MBW8481688.1 hypothetical protein [Actinomadura parmotrematis]